MLTVGQVKPPQGVVRIFHSGALKDEELIQLHDYLESLQNKDKAKAKNELLELFPQSIVSRLRVDKQNQILKNNLIPKLEKLLGHYSDVVAGLSARTLSNFGAIESTSKIEKLLDRNEPLVLSYAIEALGNLGADGTLPRLQGLLNHKDFVVTLHTAKALYKLGDKDKAILKLGELLGSENEWIVMNTALAIGNLRAKELIPKLEERLNCKDEYAVLEVAGALGKLGVRDKAIPMLEKLLMHNASHNPDTDKLAVKALGNLGAKESTLKIEELLSYKGKSPNFVIAAAEALLKLGITYKAVPKLEELLSHDIYAITAAEVLVRFGVTDKAIPKLEKLLYDNEHRTSIQAAETLGKIGLLDKVIPRLEKFLGRNFLLLKQRDWVIIEALKVLGKIGVQEAIPQLEKYLNHKDYHTVWDAVSALDKVFSKNS